MLPRTPARRMQEHRKNVTYSITKEEKMSIRFTFEKETKGAA